MRAAARLAFDERIVLLEQIADGELRILVGDPETGEARDVRQPSFADRISAIAELGRIGMGPPLSTDDVQMRLIEQARVLRSLLDPEVCDRVFKALADVWK